MWLRRSWAHTHPHVAFAGFFPAGHRPRLATPTILTPARQCPPSRKWAPDIRPSSNGAGIRSTTPWPADTRGLPVYAEGCGALLVGPADKSAGADPFFFFPFSRMFASYLGIPEDEAVPCAAASGGFTDDLSRRLTIPAMARASPILQPSEPRRAGFGSRARVVTANAQGRSPDDPAGHLGGLRVGVSGVTRRALDLPPRSPSCRRERTCRITEAES